MSAILEACSNLVDEIGRGKDCLAFFEMEETHTCNVGS